MQKLIVLGAGESGVGAGHLGKVKGWEVFLSDKGSIKEKYKNVLTNLEIEFEEGKHTSEKILQADLIVKSPGIPEDIPLVVEAREKGIKVVSEIEFAAKYSKAKLIGITGSNGKTTTATLTQHILKNAGLNSVLAGNIGNSMAAEIAKGNDPDFFVLELSSFQLDGMVKTKLDIAVLLNITEDHLDRYQYVFQNYIDSKFRIIQNQKANDAFIYCVDDEVIQKQMEGLELTQKLFPFSLKTQVQQGAEISNNQLNIKVNQINCTMSIQNLALQGKHNIYNSMAAGVAARILEIRKDVIRDSLSDFESIEHRLETVVTVYGVDYINDSKATNINSTWYALETIDKKIVWIVGGVDKGNDYSILAEIVKEKVKAIVCLGKDNAKIIEAFKGDIETIVEANNMTEAVGYSYQLASKDEVVLLSPACASFDLFDNYEDRGRQFKEAVRSL
jgi:UDP-N-acetylmuramoylalanine--D-glutamate ligase